MAERLTRAALAALDAADPLAPHRALFDRAVGIVYLDGNSLGPLPRATPARVAEVVTRQWGIDLIGSWNNHGWIDLPRRVGDKIARIIGAQPGEVVATDSTSVNLFKLLAGALRLRPDRSVILSERDNFPTDLYMAQGLAEFVAAMGGRRCELRLVEAAALPGAIDRQTAAVMLTHVDYRSGALHDMAAITAAAQAQGALAIWDLAHSAGAVPLNVAAAKVDLAVGCGYKYLNGGPGAPAFVYVAARHQDGFAQPLSGWLSHAEPFAFEATYRPAPGIGRMLCGTPPVLSLAALEVGVDTVLAADSMAMREKSMRLGDIFIALIEQECAGHGLTLFSPREAARRGSQVSFRHPQGYPIVRALIARGVIGDFRAPDILRFGLAPLYLRFIDLWDAVAALRSVLEERSHEQPAFQQRSYVT